MDVRTLLLLILAVSAWAQSQPEVKDWSSVRIRLERSACFGACASYSVEITGDGDVVFEGRVNVSGMGTHRAQISKDAVKQLVERFRSASFFSLANGGSVADGGRLLPVLDAQNNTLNISVDGVTARNLRADGAELGSPAIARELESLVDQVAGTRVWVER